MIGACLFIRLEDQILNWVCFLYNQQKSDTYLTKFVFKGTSGESGSNDSNGMTIYLNRQTGLDRTCRVKFNMRVGEGENMTESGARDELSDLDGKSFGWLPRVKFSDCISRGIFKLLVEMVSINTVRKPIVRISPIHSSQLLCLLQISQVELPIIPPNPIGLPLYDKDKLAWEIETDLNSDTLKVRLVHKDVKNVPRNHIRYVCWSAYLLKKHPKLESKLGAAIHDTNTTEDTIRTSVATDYTAKLPLDQKVYFQYYVQDDTDDGGVLMDTKIPIKEVLRSTTCSSSLFYSF